VQHLVQAQVPGCFVECGVWRGGSSMAIALTLRQLGVSDRDLYLYDTYTGMTPPTEVDRSPEGLPAEVLLTANADMRCIADEDDVRRNLALTGYPAARVHFVAGKVEETLPAHAPREPIALLRLDTDWYESTKHELETLYPRLVSGGILLVDDYGHWAGSKKAVDEYFAGRPIYLHRVDFSGRLLIKP
jgi:O-methyltransferase